ncbi:hypothetical protein HS7_19130 [Sulfolobales archaeon HS-7]|nr:hypothetical protein HS7_19130 [Sulfolobales archaeon HS-7]
MGEYTTCNLYRPTDEKEGIEKFEADTVVGFYKEVNSITEDISSECPFFKLIDIDNVKLAICKVENRVLTKSQASLCNKNWRDCPFYNREVF